MHESWTAHKQKLKGGMGYGFFFCHFSAAGCFGLVGRPGLGGYHISQSWCWYCQLKRDQVLFVGLDGQINNVGFMRLLRA